LETGPQALIDLKAVKKTTRGITAEEHRELVEKQLRAVHKLKKDFGCRKRALIRVKEPLKEPH
jgi:hypothetical protein